MTCMVTCDSECCWRYPALGGLLSGSGFHLMAPGALQLLLLPGSVMWQEDLQSYADIISPTLILTAAILFTEIQ